MGKKLYKVVGLDCDDGECDIDIGCCEDESLAKRIAEMLQKRHDESVEFWNNTARNCICNCEAWKNKDDAGALQALKQMEEFKCPYKKDIHIGEVFFGGGDHGEETSGGYEIWCGGRSERCECPWSYNYHVEPIELLTEEFLNNPDLV